MLNLSVLSNRFFPGLVMRFCPFFRVLWLKIRAGFSAVFLLSCWYTKKEMAARTAILFSGSQLGNAFGYIRLHFQLLRDIFADFPNFRHWKSCRTLLARAILTIDGAHGIAGWRWLFISMLHQVRFGIALAKPPLPQSREL